MKQLLPTPSPARPHRLPKETPEARTSGKKRARSIEQSPPLASTSSYQTGMLHPEASSSWSIEDGGQKLGRPLSYPPGFSPARYYQELERPWGTFRDPIRDHRLATAAAVIAPRTRETLTCGGWDESPFLVQPPFMAIDPRLIGGELVNSQFYTSGSLVYNAYGDGGLARSTGGGGPGQPMVMMAANARFNRKQSSLFGGHLVSTPNRDENESQICAVHPFGMISLLEGRDENLPLSQSLQGAHAHLPTPLIEPEDAQDAQKHPDSIGYTQHIENSGIQGGDERDCSSPSLSDCDISDDSSPDEDLEAEVSNHAANGATRAKPAIRADPNRRYTDEQVTWLKALWREYQQYPAEELIRDWDANTARFNKRFGASRSTRALVKKVGRLCFDYLLSPPATQLPPPVETPAGTPAALVRSGKTLWIPEQEQWLAGAVLDAIPDMDLVKTLKDQVLGKPPENVAEWEMIVDQFEKKFGVKKSVKGLKCRWSKNMMDGLRAAAGMGSAGEIE